MFPSQKRPVEVEYQNEELGTLTRSLLEDIRQEEREEEEEGEEEGVEDIGGRG